MSDNLGHVPETQFVHTIDNLRVDFENATEGIVYSYYWDFGDGSTSTEQHPSHEYIDAGEYTVTLESSNDCGSSSMSIDVVILESSTTATNDIAGLTNFSVGPNPAYENIRVKADFTEARDISINLISLTGQRYNLGYSTSQSLEQSIETSRLSLVPLVAPVLSVHL